MKKNFYIILVFITCQIYALDVNLNRISRRENRVKPSERIIIPYKNLPKEKINLIKKKATRIFSKKTKHVFANNSKSRIKSFSTRNAGDWFSYMFDDFEGVFPNYWMLEGLPTWGITDYQAADGIFSVWCAGSDYSPAGSYVNNMNSWMIDGPFDMTGTKNAEFYFDYWIDTEPDYDSLFIGFSTDGESFFGNTYSGNSEGWVYDELINLVEYAGEQNLFVGINFISDDINSDYKGAFVDNVELDGYQSSVTEKRIDLKVYGLKVFEPEADGKFKFKLKNNGPAACETEDYLIKVYVNGEEDSSSYNQKSLNPKEIAIWDWQLAYIYPPGLLLVEVEVFSFYTEKTPENNFLQFNIISKGINLTVLNISETTGAVSKTFSMMLSATNGTPPYSWSYSSGQLPSELFVSGEGKIVGTPEISGNFIFNIAVRDAGGSMAYKKITLEIVESSDLVAPQIFEKVLPVAFLNSFYEEKLKGVGGAEPYSWSDFGDLPDGLVLSSSGNLSGTPTVSGKYIFPVLLKGDDGQESKTDIILTVKKLTDSLTGIIEKSLIKIKDNSKDFLKIKAEFDLPLNFVLDKYTRLVIYIDDFPTSFANPQNAKWRKKATFKSEKNEVQKSKAILNWTSKNHLKLSFSLKKADLTKILEGYDLSDDVVLPIRIVINEKDTGIIQQAFSVK